MNQGKSMGIRRRLVTMGIATMLLTAGLMSGCAMMDRSSDMRQISGTVTYRERMMVPPDATVTVALEDVSLADAPADQIAETSFKADGAPPWNYTLTYDPARIMEHRRYNLRAKVTRDDKLLFITTGAHPVVPALQMEPVDVVVSRAGGTVASEARATSEAHSLVGTFWELTHVRGDAIDGQTDKRKLNMVLTDDGKRVSGFSGCNQFSGTYSLDGDRLSVSQLASTRMACFAGMDTEQAFQKALQDVTHYQQQGAELRLLNADDDVVLRFASGDPAN